MRNLLLVLLLSLPALALPTPHEVVNKLYRTHIKTQDMRKTVAQLPRSFSPEFLGILQRALAKPTVDIDIFTHSQTSLSDFILDPVTPKQSRNAQVHVQVWVSSRLGQHAGPPEKVTYYLTDEEDGAGYQITDIQFLSKPHFKVREFLLPLADGR